MPIKNITIWFKKSMFWLYYNNFDQCNKTIQLIRNLIIFNPVAPKFGKINPAILKYLSRV